MVENKNQILWAKAPSGAEIKIPILGVCGEFESGKTLFALTIAPGVHPAGHPFAGKPKTCVIDIEKSSENYAESQLGFERIDLPQKIMSNPAKKAYTSIDLYDEFRKTALAIPDGSYDVLVVDPITDIDSGLTDYVKDNPEKFGLTKAKIEKTSGLLWGVVKEEWNKLLLLLSTKCKTFAFTAHMRDVYVGNTPSGKREPKGKETLAKLATLYLEMQRKPVGGVIPTVPTAIRLKSRICDTLFDPATGEITTVELLPKVIQACTPATIRKLIANPITGESKYAEDHLSADMRLAFQVEMETKRAEANNAELELAERRAKLISGMGAVKTEIPSTVSVQKQSSVSQVKETFPAPPPPMVKSATPAKTAMTEPPQPKPSQPEPTQPESVVTEPMNTPDAESLSKEAANNPMWSGGVEFPPPEIPPRAEAMEQLKTLRDGGYFSKDDLSAALNLYGVIKVSELSNDAFESLFLHAKLVKEIIDEAIKRGIPRTKLNEFVVQAKEPGLFVATMATKEAIRDLILKQPVPQP